MQSFFKKPFEEVFGVFDWFTGIGTSSNTPIISSPSESCSNTGQSHWPKSSCCWTGQPSWSIQLWFWDPSRDSGLYGTVLALGPLPAGLANHQGPDMCNLTQDWPGNYLSPLSRKRKKREAKEKGGEERKWESKKKKKRKGKRKREMEDVCLFLSFLFFFFWTYFYL